MSFPFWHKLKYIVEYFLLLFAYKHCVHHFMLHFIISASENGLLCLNNIHTTLSEHSVAFCCCVIDVTRFLLAAWYDDFTAFIFVVHTTEFWRNLFSEFLGFVLWCCFKLEIFITAIVSRHIKHMSLVLVGVHFSVHFSLNCWFSLSIFLVAVNLEHAILQSAKCKRLQKRKWKLKIALAAVSDPAVCVLLAWRQVQV